MSILPSALLSLLLEIEMLLFSSFLGLITTKWGKTERAVNELFPFMYFLFFFGAFATDVNFIYLLINCVHVSLSAFHTLTTVYNLLCLMCEATFLYGKQSRVSISGKIR